MFIFCEPRAENRVSATPPRLRFARGTLRGMVLPLVNTSMQPLPGPEGTALLAAQPATSQVWSLLVALQMQRTQSFCSAATSATLLNELGVPAPVDVMYAPHAYFTQTNLFGPCALALRSHVQGQPISAGFLATHGATLDEWAAYTGCFADTRAMHAAQSTVSTFRDDALAALTSTSPRAAIGINYLRTALEQRGGGHMSPLAAYDAAGDRFLVLDVARYRYPPVWVPTGVLFDAMNTTDAASGQSRGWLVVSVNESEHGAPAAAVQQTDVVRRTSWEAVKACVRELAPEDAHGVVACFTVASRRPPSSGFRSSVLGACVGGAATLLLTLVVCCVSRRRAAARGKGGARAAPPRAAPRSLELHGLAPRAGRGSKRADGSLLGRQAKSDSLGEIALRSVGAPLRTPSPLPHALVRTRVLLRACPRPLPACTPPHVVCQGRTRTRTRRRRRRPPAARGSRR